jgi:SAM-dependent methyltransferase
MARHAWEREAENWLAWARTPGFDAYLYYRDEFFEAIVPPGGGRTVEIGCGEGRVARDLAARGHAVVAIDIVARLLEHARSVAPGLLYARANAAALPFGDETFNTAVAYNSLMDVDDTPASVREAARVLKPNGVFCACVIHPMRDAGEFTGDETDADFVVSGTYFGPRPFKGTLERDGRSITFEGWSYSLQDYAQAFEAAGFVLERVREPHPSRQAVDVYPPWARWMRIPMFLFVRAVKRF